jgi:hypothetical protein
LSLAEDLELIRADTGLNVDDMTALVENEHARYHFYLKAIALIPPPDDRTFLRILLRDPDAAMGRSAATQLAAKQAQRHSTYNSFMSWAQDVSDITNSNDFLSQRIREWADFKRVMEGGDFSADFFDVSTNWLQLKLAEELASPEHLARLAQVGRTKRIRNTAKQRSGKI